MKFDCALRPEGPKYNFFARIFNFLPAPDFLRLAADSKFSAAGLRLIDQKSVGGAERLAQGSNRHIKIRFLPFLRNHVLLK
jgi:hypothetical protein